MLACCDGHAFSVGRSSRAADHRLGVLFAKGKHRLREAKPRSGRRMLRLSKFSQLLRFNRFCRITYKFLFSEIQACASQTWIPIQHECPIRSSVRKLFCCTGSGLGSEIPGNRVGFGHQSSGPAYIVALPGRLGVRTYFPKWSMRTNFAWPISPISSGESLPFHSYQYPTLDPKPNLQYTTSAYQSFINRCVRRRISVSK